MERVTAPLRCCSECHSAEKFTDDGVGDGDFSGAVSRRQQAVAVLLNSTQSGAAGGTCPHRHRLRPYLAPGLEAHGGYTFCGTAAMVILGKEHMLDLKTLLVSSLHISSLHIRSRDFYHTCYCLSGLSVAQHSGNMDLHHELIVGREENRLAPSHPVYNICPEKVAQAIEHFHQLSVPMPAQKEGSSA